VEKGRRPISGSRCAAPPTSVHFWGEGTHFKAVERFVRNNLFLVEGQPLLVEGLCVWRPTWEKETISM